VREPEDVPVEKYAELDGHTAPAINAKSLKWKLRRGVGEQTSGLRFALVR